MKIEMLAIILIGLGMIFHYLKTRKLEYMIKEQREILEEYKKVIR